MNAAALMGTRVNPRCACSRRLSVSDHYLRLFFVGVVFAIVVTVARAAEELPAVTVTGRSTPSPIPPGDTVSRDWAERSPEVDWPTPMFNKAAEIFTHNQIVINASCETVWNHLVHPELWPHWCPYSGKVTISGGSPVLQKNTRFTWTSSDVPQETGAFSGIPADRVDGLVIECAPPNRLGWRSFGRQWTIHGPLISSYHNWYIKSMGLKKCVVTFEEVATGVAASYARGAYPEYVHLAHDHWLEGLKRISETRS
jgi:Polyketide cyclase / dehydrase and lipid transport